MGSIKLLLLALVVGLGGCSAPLTPLSEPVEGQGDLKMGVQTKYMQVTAEDLEHIRATGFTLIRVGARRELMEDTSGTINWQRMDALVAKAESLNMAVLMTLIDKDVSRRETFPQFVGKVVRHYRDHPQVRFEIWNEPDYKFFWPGAPQPEAVARLVEASCRAAQAANPGVTVYAAGLTADAIDPAKGYAFLKALSSLVRPGCLAGLSIHPYRGGGPETLAEEHAQLKARFPGVPFVVSEWGYSRYVSPHAHGDRSLYAGRIMLAAYLEHLPLTVLYEWQDSGTNPREREDNFGLIRKDGTPLPALNLTRQALAWVGDGKAVQCHVEENPAVFCLKRPGKGSTWRYLLWAETPVALKGEPWSHQGVIFHRWGAEASQTLHGGQALPVQGVPLELNVKNDHII